MKDCIEINTVGDYINLLKQYPEDSEYIMESAKVIPPGKDGEDRIAICIKYLPNDNEDTDTKEVKDKAETKVKDDDKPDSVQNYIDDINNFYDVGADPDTLSMIRSLSDNTLLNCPVCIPTEWQIKMEQKLPKNYQDLIACMRYDNVFKAEALSELTRRALLGLFESNTQNIARALHAVNKEMCVIKD